MNSLLFDHFSLLLITAAVFAILSVFSMFNLFQKVRRRRTSKSVMELLKLATFSSIMLITGFIAIGTVGYQALTHEDVVAIIRITPTGHQQFKANITRHGETTKTFYLLGDQFLADAKILKWKPWVNLLGLHTAYRLDRVMGRYVDVNDEQSKPRTVFQMNNRQDNDIATWRQQYSGLSFLLDVEHGSASHVNASQSGKYELIVTTSGLLIRPQKR